MSSGRRITGSLKLQLLSLEHPQEADLIKRVRKDKLTYLDMSALVDIYYAVKQIEDENLGGDLVEAGCALGGSALIIAASKNQDRNFYVYDVFETIPSPSDMDDQDSHSRYQEIISGKSKGIQGEVYYGYQEGLYQRVLETFENYGYSTNQNNIKLIKGLFQDTLSIEKPVAFGHIDADWYNSVMVCLERIEPNLVNGGALVIDDYYDWSGCRKAVDTYFKDKKNNYKFLRKSRLHVIKK